MSGEEALYVLRQVNVIGVVSDTHGHVWNTRQAIRILESLVVDAVLHCGDVGSSEIPPLFHPWPTHYVLGNVDSRGEQLRAAMEAAGGVCHGRFGGLEAAGRKLALLHGDDSWRLEREIAGGHWDLICHGHTHSAQSYLVGRTRVLNPGAIDRAHPPSIAVVDLRDLQVQLIPLD